MDRTMTADTDIMQAVPARARLFSLCGRLGRAHYIAYTLGSLVVAFFFIYLLSFGLMFLGELGRMLYILVSVLLFYGFLPIFFTLQTIKRAHDFNVGGWLALLLLVPVVNLMFCFIPGTRADNTYGPVPPAPSSGLKAGAILLPILLIAGFLATEGSRNSQQESTPTSPPATSLKPYTP